MTDEYIPKRAKPDDGYDYIPQQNTENEASAERQGGEDDFVSNL